MPVSGVNVVVVVAPVAEVLVKVTGVPLCRPLTSAWALVLEPARLVNSVVSRVVSCVVVVLVVVVVVVVVLVCA